MSSMDHTGVGVISVRPSMTLESYWYKGSYWSGKGGAVSTSKINRKVSFFFFLTVVPVM